jgi:hypothetical protein
VFPHVESAAGADAPITIHDFYSAILGALAKLPPSSWADPARNQIGPDVVFGSVVVTDLATATTAITTIVEQGEGTTKSPEEIVGASLAHYYRFMQIKEGRALIATSAPPGYAYAGDPIMLDPTGVRALPTDPTAAAYPAGSPQRAACDTFNQTYAELLGVLHGFLNGSGTSSVFAQALGIMGALRKQALAMAAGIPGPSSPLGPTFELPATRSVGEPS